MRKIPIVFYYLKQNRNSFNALAGALEKFPDIQRTDVYFPESEENLVEEVNRLSEDCQKMTVGISFGTPQFWHIETLVQTLKEKVGHRILLVAGGPHPTGAPQETLRAGFDLVIHGEGEATLLELLQKIGRDEDPRRVRGVSFLDSEGNHVFTGKRGAINLDNYPPISDFFSKYGPIEITRGCPFACSYCQVSHLFGQKPRHRSIDNILDGVSRLKRRGSTYFRFISPNAFSYGSEDGKAIHYEKLDALLSGVRHIVGKRGKIFFGSFPSEVRPEHVNSETLGMVKQYADNDNIIIGAQSGSPRMLEMIHRGHNVESIWKAVEAILRAELKANVDFIFGLPDETEEDLSFTLKLIRDLHKLGARIHAHAFMPLPQTPLEKRSASRISHALKREMDKLCSEGILYGQWRRQEKIAAKIAAEFRHLRG